ncbi:MAG: DUF4159 domain-containing protein [Candidatus Marinimicrobia bacterium]|nr:DUF4159 domain-containing protein [Candidatus Neomarinimicrobiota bacterium]
MKVLYLKINFFLILTSVLLMSAEETAGKFTLARLKYGGGGDWYSDPSSLPNLLQFINETTKIDVNLKEARVSPTDNDFFNFPYLYMTGHGNVKFTETEIEQLQKYFAAGGFLHCDDNYGIDASFRREIKRIFPNHDWVELPFDHEIYHCYFDFPLGLPKIHEHDNKPSQGFGIFLDGRLVLFYTYECDLGDGWESPNVQNNPEPKRLEALRMGTNIVVYALTH